MHCGITVWGSANQANIKSVQRLQSRCARLLTGYFYHDISSLGILCQLGLLNVKQMYSLFVCIMMYKFLIDSMPNHYVTHQHPCIIVITMTQGMNYYLRFHSLILIMAN